MMPDPRPAPPILLASGSPRRRELLTNLGVPFRIVVSGEDEASEERDPARLAGTLARQKAAAVARQHPGAVVIGADTVVALGGELLAKPGDEAENRAFVRRLSGRTHQVYTGVSVFAPDGERGPVERGGVERTDVTFRLLTEAEIAHYAATGEGLDKAGGYGIQGVGMALVARIEGDYSNVVGFPLGLVIRLLRAAGVRVWE
ncbi:Maf family nucleotide pyrophosphatase [Deinococcus sp. MIMF12]|uniref:dTTP/UTP pyrophosphatase n=1 Tax=Deinococcus rhizophilus TaxID=3049544 RepID=A0ABT7JGQ6_9DEIO|nr:Maf family nucleotide pyrophosphatase [Deinococcus rhizophilus]MDL2344096.1 Maf family nucleotide pyrophosphatase [Deinococcus rhizophilus]